ncbi:MULTISPECIES: glycosyltransferase family 2 protein [Methylomonas]|uniref:Glycosyl transferase family 2 n=2 Tax=Methylomonas TaxID=416 RepID=A0A126T585_9GAMM|nr:MULTISPECIES: glycosyltransferase family 2 protein [Methylomonas]AMK77232.1 glycosyl transferase family 2 [Methylomonas denitrificans]OAI03131.1 glycosyl transferase family 2 [Methylomonas methanica]TCV76450.1 glycosyltransferase involved in cell wall biosynthesis [Methylomonas methanica]
MLSIIVPAYNEEEVLYEFYRRITGVLEGLGLPYELVFVNDGSRDDTLALLESLSRQDDRVVVIDLSRNFGKEIAVSAGIDFARGEAIVIIDADLQDPPELIPALVEQWRNGYDNIYARRISRDGESIIKKTTSFLFYRFIRGMTQIDIPADTGDFRLLSRRAVDALKQLPERNRFMKGLYAWIGYPAIAVDYKRDPRYAGETKWNYWKLWNFALEGITSFTEIPLKLASYIGGFVAFMAFCYGAYIIVDTIVFGNDVAGYPSLIVTILFLGGIQLIFIGILGEYLGRAFSETKRRPLYFVNKIIKK